MSNPKSLALAALLGLAVPTCTLVASPSVPLRDVTLSAQGDFNRGCAFVGQRLYCWGGNLQGELGIGVPSVTSLAEWVRRPAVPSGDFDQPRSLAVQDRACLVDNAGLWCWGTNARGQLGVGDRVLRTRPGLVPGLPADPVEVVFGRFHTCLRTTASGAWCWGNNVLGETGQPPGDAVPDPLTGEILPPPQLLAMQVPGLPDTLTEIAAREQHNCALGDGVVHCWGRNDYGQLGDGGTVNRPGPAPVAGLPAGIARIAVGPRHACAIDGDGAVWCWGYNFAGQIGVAPTAERQIEPVPLRVEGLGGAAGRLELGFVSSCALVAGERRCWGQLEDGTRIGPLPQVVARPTGAPADWLAGCFPVDGELRCPRTARAPQTQLDAREVPGLPGRPQQLALGRDFACARMADGGVWCWGSNSSGQLGQGDFEARNTALRVPLPSALGVSAGIAHACASTVDGLWCWGANATGALGDGSTVHRASPVRAHFAGELVAAGGYHSCAYAANAGGLRCWGQDHRGQVSGAPGNPVPGLASPLGTLAIAELGAGVAHTCAAVVAGSAREYRCWGDIALSDNELAAGIIDFGPRVLPAGANLPPADGPQLRVSAFTACAGDRCTGQNYLPPDRGTRRIGAPVILPSGAERSFALGGRLACAQGPGTDVRCASLVGRACAFDSAIGLILTPGQGISCSFGESLLTAQERGWVGVPGLPGTPARIQAGEQYACAVAGSGVWCWGTRVPLADIPPAPEYAPVYRGGALEPAPLVPVLPNPALGCPAYLVSSVELLDGSQSANAGAWGQEVLLQGGRGYLNGGLNFGGFGSSDGPGIPGYAAFSIASPGAVGQRVTLELRGDGGEFDLTVESTVPPATGRTEILRERVLLTDSVLRRNLTLADGFHIVALNPVGGSRLFLAQVGTTQLDGGPAAFLGGAVVGGYLSGGKTGFAALCTDDASGLRIRTEARSARGAVGAGDLHLKVLDGQTGALLYDSEGAPGSIFSGGGEGVPGP